MCSLNYNWIWYRQ